VNSRPDPRLSPPCLSPIPQSLNPNHCFSTLVLRIRARRSSGRVSASSIFPYTLPSSVSSNPFVFTVFTKLPVCIGIVPILKLSAPALSARKLLGSLCANLLCSLELLNFQRINFRLLSTVSCQLSARITPLECAVEHPMRDASPACPVHDGEESIATEGSLRKRKSFRMRSSAISPPNSFRMRSYKNAPPQVL